MLFNLIPLAPLDGEKVLEFFIPENLRSGFDKIKQYGPILLIVLIFVLPRVGFDIIGVVLRPALTGLFTLLVGGI